MVKICVFVPTTHLETVKQAMFAEGAGKIGDYDHCCWQTLGTGQFRPLAGSQPFIGNIEQGKLAGEVETVEEYKIELVCEKALLTATIAAMRKAHPYEEPAFDVIELLQV